jgi:hypothetical protein
MFVCAAAGVALLTGCGRAPSDRAQVRTALSDFGAATAKRDYQALCDRLLSTALVRKLQHIGLPCEVALKTGLGAVQEPVLTVRRISVDGDRASAQVHTTAANQAPSDDTIQLRKEDGSWRIASLGG